LHWSGKRSTTGGGLKNEKESGKKKNIVKFLDGFDIESEQEIAQNREGQVGGEKTWKQQKGHLTAAV